MAVRISASETAGTAALAGLLGMRIGFDMIVIYGRRSSLCMLEQKSL
jgi:hypothetical protein